MYNREILGQSGVLALWAVAQGAHESVFPRVRSIGSLQNYPGNLFKSII